MVITFAGIRRNTFAVSWMLTRKCEQRCRFVLPAGYSDRSVRREEKNLETCSIADIYFGCSDCGVVYPSLMKYEIVVTVFLSCLSLFHRDTQYCVYRVAKLSSFVVHPSPCRWYTQFLNLTSNSRMCPVKKSTSESVGCTHEPLNDHRSREATLSTAIIRNSVCRATTTLPHLREPRVFQRTVNNSWKKNHLRKWDVCM